MKWRLGSARHVKPVRENVLQTVRRGMLANVSGDVIELGAGDGKSLPYYPYQNLDSLTLVDARFSRSVHKQDMRHMSLISAEVQSGATEVMEATANYQYSQKLLILMRC